MNEDIIFKLGYCYERLKELEADIQKNEEFRIQTETRHNIYKYIMTSGWVATGIIWVYNIIIK